MLKFQDCIQATTSLTSYNDAIGRFPSLAELKGGSEDAKWYTQDFDKGLHPVSACRSWCRVKQEKGSISLLLSESSFERYMRKIRQSWHEHLEKILHFSEHQWLNKLRSMVNDALCDTQIHWHHRGSQLKRCRYTLHPETIDDNVTRTVKLVHQQLKQEGHRVARLGKERTARCQLARLKDREWMLDFAEGRPIKIPTASLRLVWHTELVHSNKRKLQNLFGLAKRRRHHDVSEVIDLETCSLPLRDTSPVTVE